MKNLLLVVALFISMSIFSQEKLRFRASIDGSKGFGQKLSSSTQTVGNVMATVTLGVAIKGFSLGAGSGIFKMDGTKKQDHYIPVYGELAYQVQREKVQPFFGIKVGRLTPKKEQNTPWPEINKATMMYNPVIGLAIDAKALYIMPFLQYLVPADFDSRYDTFGAGLRLMTH